ncbi:MAG: 16S rRNA (uracil(1498)-N(3))-methyltransferase [Phycisphaerae bacterium]|nr:16S rRNA (uracil(1498)-N(3))-methyltransferase [Phycisphaerae bacterium]
MRRFFAEDITGDAVDLPAAEAHHARHALRLRDGEPVELFDGHGDAATGRLVLIGRKGARVAVDSRRTAPPPAPPGVELAFAVPKGKRLDWLLEKATELAAAALRPVHFARSVAGPSHLSPAGRQRWRDRCVAAAKQAGVWHLPRVGEPVALDDYLAAVTAPRRLLGAPEALETVAGALAAGDTDADVALLIGPEGGLTDAESDAARAAGFTPVRLGGTTLRTETAAIALLAAVRAVSDASR